MVKLAISLAFETPGYTYYLLDFVSQGIVYDQINNLVIVCIIATRSHVYGDGQVRLQSKKNM